MQQSPGQQFSWRDKLSHLNILKPGSPLKRGFASIREWISPPVPASIAEDLQFAQFDSVRRQVPMLLGVAALNIIVIMAVCAHDGLPPSRYYWMGGVAFYCLIRLFFWLVKTRTPQKPEAMQRLLQVTNLGALVMITVLGLVTSYTFAVGTFKSQILIPMSLGLGTLCIAHCLYTLRSSAIAVLVMGLIPNAVVMSLLGSFQAQMLAISMMSVAVLMLRFVTAQYDQMIIGLLLAEDNRQLALTDPLTGLANRRATMAVLDEAAQSVLPFAVALIDLDEFKPINDTYGHHVGDDLLCEIAVRLEDNIKSGDVAGRLGGDEFIVVMRNVTGDADCQARTSALLTSLCRPVIVEGHPLKFGASLGYAMVGVHGKCVTELMTHADAALYAAKAEKQSTAVRTIPLRAVVGFDS